MPRACISHGGCDIGARDKPSPRLNVALRSPSSSLNSVHCLDSVHLSHRFHSLFADVSSPVGPSLNSPHQAVCMQNSTLSASTLFDLIRPRSDFSRLTKPAKLQLATCATLAAGNLVKVPLVLLLSALTAAPLGVVAWKLLGEETSVTDLVLAHARGLLAGALLLGTLVPIVALYYHSSRFAGPLLADATAIASLAVGVLVFVRLALKAPGNHNPTVRIAVPSLMVVLQGAAMLQLIALASPILPDPTMFRDGVDGLVKTSSAEAP